MIIPKVSDTLFSFHVSDSLNHSMWALSMTPCSSCSHSAFVPTLKTTLLYSAKWFENTSGGHKTQLTIHGVVAGRGLLAEAAAHGEALRLGHRVWSTGETVVAGKVAL